MDQMSAPEVDGKAIIRNPFGISENRFSGEDEDSMWERAALQAWMLHLETLERWARMAYLPTFGPLLWPPWNAGAKTHTGAETREWYTELERIAPIVLEESAP